MKCYQGLPKVGKIGTTKGKVGMAKKNGVGARQNKQGKARYVKQSGTRAKQSRQDR
jgi:hypothetical protein